MRTNLVVVWLLLILLSPAVFAAEEVLQGQDAANKFLAAEVTRQMQVSQKAIIQEVNDYNDQNFQIFDVRMNELMTDLRTKSILGVIGAALIASGISTLIMMRMVKNYSYEKYQERLISKYKEQEELRPEVGVGQMQQSAWNVQPQPSNITAQLGVAAVANQSQMNAWQAVPTHDGAWQPPIQKEQEFVQYPTYPQYSSQQDPEDPLASPGWDIRGF